MSIIINGAPKSATLFVAEIIRYNLKREDLRVSTRGTLTPTADIDVPDFTMLDYTKSKHYRSGKSGQFLEEFVEPQIQKMMYLEIKKNPALFRYLKMLQSNFIEEVFA